jgi:hypothetical protein
MFKRVAKRVKRKEEEEALGLDEDMKEALGMHDTDSDESESDSSEDDDSQSEAGSDGTEPSRSLGLTIIDLVHRRKSGRRR